MKLSIKTDAIRIPIERDGQETGSITLDVTDVGLIQGYYDLISSFEELAEKYRRERDKLDAQEDPAPQAYFDLMREIGLTVREGIDNLFGPGTALAAFGPGVGSPRLYSQFFDGLNEVISSARSPKVGRYLADLAEHQPDQEDGLL